LLDFYLESAGAYLFCREYSGRIKGLLVVFRHSWKAWIAIISSKSNLIIRRKAVSNFFGKWLETEKRATPFHFFKSSGISIPLSQPHIPFCRSFRAFLSVEFHS
jgi:hypothetical protein